MILPQPGHTLGKPDGLPQTPHVIRGIDGVLVADPSRPSGWRYMELRSSQRVTLQRARELGKHAIHHRRVECMRDIEQLRLDPLAAEPGRKRRDRRLRPGDDAAFGGIDGRDLDPVAQPSLQRIGTHRNRQHGARRSRLHQPAAKRNQFERRLETYHARGARAQVFAQTVPDQEIWAIPPMLPELEQSIFDRKERRLSVRGLPQCRRMSLSADWP